MNYINTLLVFCHRVYKKPLLNLLIQKAQLQYNHGNYGSHSCRSNACWSACPYTGCLGNCFNQGSTLFSKRSAHENHPYFLRSLGHRPRLRIILILSIGLETLGQGQWPRVNRRTGVNQCALLLKKSVAGILSVVVVFVTVVKAHAITISTTLVSGYTWSIIHKLF